MQDRPSVHMTYPLRSQMAIEIATPRTSDGDGLQRYRSDGTHSSMIRMGIGPWLMIPRVGIPQPLIGSIGLRRVLIRVWLCWEFRCRR